mgnify:FL=1
MQDNLYSRIYIDAHLCRKECGSLGIVNQKYQKGIVYLAMFKGPWLAAIFLQNEGYDNITDEICNLCGDKVQIVRELSTISKRFCRRCDDYFELETVSWSSFSFTIYGEEIVRDVQLSECKKHYTHQDELFI